MSVHDITMSIIMKNDQHHMILITLSLLSSPNIEDFFLCFYDYVNVVTRLYRHCGTGCPTGSGSFLLAMGDAVYLRITWPITKSSSISRLSPLQHMANAKSFLQSQVGRYVHWSTKIPYMVSYYRNYGRAVIVANGDSPDTIYPKSPPKTLSNILL